ncbi:amidase [Natrialba hulunbeirensis JCM 10989]|uniref:Amidase n=1 Tax=Natrialba hulunbeirensis JCM 10989 TaxID=1227493 RepID=M0A6I2_9EURY|nr:amidase [Natrialba hulunbeirensis]ELY94169.1 amidase [Natrialba hulunbeirensis JCM 10989]
MSRERHETDSLDESALTRLSATELASRIRDGEVTATEAVEAHLDRIDARDDEINAFVTVCADEAREAAAEADRVLESAGADAPDGSGDSDEQIGPLHGVPIALKDLGSLKEGLPYTFGSTLFSDFVAPKTAVTVARLEDAGAIVLGTTNTPEFGHKGTTTNDVIGATASPIDTELNAGGSSGGSAAAVAAGMTPVATGSDAGGSLRIPAAACGVYGFKPTFGLVPSVSRPNGFGRARHHVTKGPLSRTVADSAALLSAMAGHHPGDPESVPVDIAFRDAVQEPSTDLRIAYSPALDVFPVTDAVRSVVDDAVASFEDAGATVEEVSVDHGYELDDLIEAVIPTFTTSMLESATVTAESHGVDLRDHPETITDSLSRMLELGEQYGPADIARSDIARTAIFDAVQDVLSEYDLLVTPTLSRANVGLHEDLDAEAWEWPLTWPFNWTGHPAASAPAGLTDAGHPVGLQLVGPRFGDDTVLAGSAVLESHRPWDHLYE